jgi:transposase InsO family protein
MIRSSGIDSWPTRSAHPGTNVAIGRRGGLCGEPVVVGVRQEARREREEARAAGSRRPGRAAVHRGPREPAAVDRHLRAPDQGKLYLCAIKDVWSNRIVGYSISDRMKSRIALDALAMAVAPTRRGSRAIRHNPSSQLANRKSTNYTDH